MDIKTKVKEILWRSPAKLYTSFFYFYKVRRGFRIYQNLLNGSSSESQLMLCPYKGTGDVYLAVALLPQYIKEHNIQSLQLIVVGGGNKKVAELFGIENVQAINQHDMDLLVRFLMFAGIKESGAYILHPDAPVMYTGICDRLRNYNSLNFMDMYAKVLYGFKKYKISTPDFSDETDEVDAIFEKYTLKKGKTVLLAPYSYTLNGIPGWVWDKLSAELKESGYSVCTNCGNSFENAIDGTIRVEIPYLLLKSFLETAGYFIGVRSGLCEMISSIRCRKIFIYQPYLFWGAGTNFDYFNMRDMGLCNDAVEIEYQGIEFIQLIDTIMDGLQD